MVNPKKSGNENRKAKRKWELEEAAALCKKLTTMFSRGPTVVTSNSENSANSNDEEKETDYEKAKNSTSNRSNNEKSCENVIDGCEETSTNNNISLTETRETHQDMFDSSHLTDEDKMPLNFRSDPLEETSECQYFSKPEANILNRFLMFHPVQPDGMLEKKLPFDEKVFFKNNDKKNVKREWLSFDAALQKLFCYICLAFSKGISSFCSGLVDFSPKHLYNRIYKHESSKEHENAVHAFIQYNQKKDVKSLISNEQLIKRKIEVAERREILNKILDVIKFLGKQGLPYRGDHEAAALLFAKHDTLLKTHVEKAIQSSTEKRDSRIKNDELAKNSGRGSLVTFLSLTIVTKLIQFIGHDMLRLISQEIKQAGIFSVMMDTTMDISSFDQCVIVARYVLETTVNERVIGLKHVKSTVAQNLFNTLDETVEELELSLENCVADAFNGAANVSGEYNSVSAKLKEVSPNHIHTWCYAHVLNLVLTDVTQCLTESVSLFGLIQSVYVFFKESYKRLQVVLDGNPVFRLSSIGATRWRSKSDATVKIFGRIDFWTDENFNDKERKHVFFEILSALSVTAESKEFCCKIRNDASALINNLRKFETILIAMTFLRIFQTTTPLSDYLQKKNLDFAQAWRQMFATSESFKK